MAILRKKVNMAAQRVAHSRNELRALKPGSFEYAFDKDFLTGKVNYLDELRVLEQNKRKGHFVGGVRKTEFMLKSLVKYGPKGLLRARQKIKNIKSNEINNGVKRSR